MEDTKKNFLSKEEVYLEAPESYPDGTRSSLGDEGSKLFGPALGVLWVLSGLCSAATKWLYLQPGTNLYHAEWLDGLFGAGIGFVFIFGGMLVVLTGFNQARRRENFFAYASLGLTVILGGILGLVGLIALANGVSRIVNAL